MRLSKFHLNTVKEVPADAEVVSHQMMIRAGMVRKLAAGIYTWAPLGLRVLQKVENVVREEMDRAGALEVLMPAVQPKELWQETERWQKFGGQLLKLRDRKEQEYCFGPTHEEVITDFARQELKSYRQLPINFYQIQTKFRDEIRPRFGIMRAREFLMKDAYSFHLDASCLASEYDNMYRTYQRIFERLGLRFRAVLADTGAIGGSASHEFHVLADSGEDAIAFSTESDYAANVELAEAVMPEPDLAAPGALKAVDTPAKKSIAEVSAFLGVKPSECVKTLIIEGKKGLVALCLRGDHELNEIKLAKLEEISGESALAAEAAVLGAVGCLPGFIGPVGLSGKLPIIVDRSAAALARFVCGANQEDKHFVDADWRRDVGAIKVADIRKVQEGDASPDGKGTLRIARGIEVGHVFQLGQKYAEAMGAQVLDAEGKAQVMFMGCYGIGVSRIVAAAIEQNYDQAGIVWPEAMAPWTVAVCIINPKANPEVDAAAEKIYRDLHARGIEAVLDDRGLRPGVMFADIELIGIPHRIVISEKGLAANAFEYRHRRAAQAESLSYPQLMEKLEASR